MQTKKSFEFCTNELDKPPFKMYNCALVVFIVFLMQEVSGSLALI